MSTVPGFPDSQPQMPLAYSVQSPRDEVMCIHNSCMPKRPPHALAVIHFSQVQCKLVGEKKSDAMTMSKSFGASVLSAFDVHEDAADFLSQLLESSDTPAKQKRSLVNASILACSEDFDHLVSCATAIQQSKPRDQNSLEGNDVLTFVWHILASERHSVDVQPAPWAETDHLILLAQELANDAPYICSPSSKICQITDAGSAKRRYRRPRSAFTNAKSHYWSEEKGASERQIRVNNAIDGRGCHQQRLDSVGCAGRYGADLSVKLTTQPSATSKQGCTVTKTVESALGDKCSHSEYRSLPIKLANNRALDPSSSSPYFAPAINDEKLSKRKLAGVVSRVPFPPLYSAQFGLVQEKMAHEPFWLLIAVTFLIKTNGQVAIPVFFKVKERFPSPSHLADPLNAEELLGMIRHLGLATNRLKFVQKYATGFLKAPPMAGKVYKVKNYDKRDIPSDSRDGKVYSIGLEDEERDMSLALETCDGKDTMEAWEIGHMTQGKYTLDSWRIFCRDQLLGRAEDWNGKGKGQEPEFQPEWMRVMPRDKELRAYLRWMWMREGWEWDPMTGERKMLRPELKRAVNEHRVEYDDEGGLRILDSPRQSSRELSHQLAE